jgi:hypothetical protein
MTPHVERHFTVVDAVRGIALGMGKEGLRRKWRTRSLKS